MKVLMTEVLSALKLVTSTVLRKAEMQDWMRERKWDRRTERRWEETLG